MKKLYTSFLSGALVICLWWTSAPEALAALPTPTTITDGQFAPDTQWYTMTIGNGRALLTSAETDGYMPLGGEELVYADSQLWCLAGNETDGFVFYNKASGTTKALSAPASPASMGENGGEAYVVLRDVNAAGRTSLWDLTASSNLNEPSYYISVHGQVANTINDRQGKLAFWTTGKDHGSSVIIKPVAPFEAVVENNVVTLSSDPLVTISSATAGATASFVNGALQLGVGEWTYSTPSDRIVATTRVNYADGTYKYTETNGFDNTRHTIQGPAAIARISFDLMEPLAALDYGVPVFITTNEYPFQVQYRIPAIATVENGQYKGRLFAVNDYRYSGADIGAGRIDLYISYSDDNGATWSQPDHMRNAQGEPVARGTGVGSQESDGNGIITQGLDVGFGDPAVVSDRETGELFVLACCGRMGYFSSTRANPQPSARWWSKDGGLTWTEPDYDQYKQVYSILGEDCPNGPIDGQFIGSGRMVQSRHIKVGDYYRIYAVTSGRNIAAGNISNWVLYSDDFGHNWHVLGGAEKPGVTVGGDEPKCEELPDGSVLLAARGNGGNRNFNIFRYTDIANGEGDWDRHINTDMGMGWLNACNGEIMIVPVKEKATGTRCYLALQSFPHGGGRNNVSIAWKSLVTPDDYDEPSDFSVWGGRYQVSHLPSAYSTMTWTADNMVGFFFEEATYTTAHTNCGTEVFSKLSIETITSDAYEYCPDDDLTVKTRMASEMLESRSSVEAPAVPAVGMITEVNAGAIQAAADFKAAGRYDLDKICEFNRMFALSSVVAAEEGGIYVFRSAHGGKYSDITSDRYLSVNGFGKLTVVDNPERGNSRFVLVSAADGEQGYYLYSPSAEKLLPLTHAETQKTMTAVAQAYQTAPYIIDSRSNGHSALISTQPGNAGYPAIHYAGGSNVVIWTSEEIASQWYMEKVGVAESLPQLNLYNISFANSAMTVTAGSDVTAEPVVLPAYKASSLALSWSSDNEAVATVDASGKITGVAPGSANVTASAGDGYAAVCAVTVTDAEGAIESIGADAADAACKFYDLQGREVCAPSRSGIYITSDRRKVRI